jgi:hypothetical protein
VVDLITSALQAAALQRSSVPDSQTKPVSSNVLSLGSNNFSSNPRSETSGLVFGPSAGFFSTNDAFLTVAKAGNSINNTDTFSANTFNTSGSSAAEIHLGELLSTNNTSIASEQLNESVSLPEANQENLITTSGETVVSNETETLIQNASLNTTVVENITSEANEPITSTQVQDITSLEPSSSPGNIGNEIDQGDQE